MTERELQNKILEILYYRYREGKSGQLFFSEIKDLLPELDRLSRVDEACRVLKDNGYIEAFFLSGNSGYVKKITALGREYVEENILSKGTVKKEKDNPKTESTLTDEDGNPITTENTIPEVITIDDRESNDSLVSTSYKTQVLSHKIKDKNVPPCFGIDDIADSFLTQLDNVSSIQEDNVCMIGIFGEWGRGKTYFFNRLKNKLNQRKDKDSVKYDIVEFNAWKYQDTPALWAYLFESIYHKAKPCVRAKYKFNRNWGAFFYEMLLFLLPTIILIVNHYIELIKIPSSTTIWSLGISSALFILKLCKDHTDVALSLIKQLQSKPDFSHHLGAQAEIEKELESLLKSWIGESETSRRKVLLFVDDIDRCPAAKMSGIVESLRVVLENEEIRKRLIVVCSIDPAKLKADISNRLKTIEADEAKLKMYVSEQLDKLFIFSIGLCRLSHSQLCQYLDTLILHKDIDSQPSNPTSNGSSPVDTSRIIGSIVAYSNPGEPIEAKASDYLNILKDELSDKEGITPRKARIIYYRILFANNILSANTGALISDSLVKQIIESSLNYDNNIDMNAAFSDVIEMVVPY